MKITPVIYPTCSISAAHYPGLIPAVGLKNPSLIKAAFGASQIEGGGFNATASPSFFQNAGRPSELFSKRRGAFFKTQGLGQPGNTILLIKYKQIHSPGLPEPLRFEKSHPAF